MDNRKNKSACLILSSTFLALALTLSACGNTNPPTSSPDANSVTTSSKQTVALTAPVVSLNGTTVCWNAVPGATSYLVNVDGNESEVTATSYSLESLTNPKDYSVSVKAKAGEVVSSSSNVVTYVLTVTLAAPVIAISGNLVSWEAVDKATSYEVFVNEVSVTTVSETHYAITDEDEGDYVVAIKAHSTDTHYLTSDISNSVKYTIAPAPEPVKLATPVVTLENKVISWSAIANATTYEIYLNDALKDETSKLNYDLSLLTAGVYSIQVDACNKASSDYSTSDKSVAVSLTIEDLSFSKPIIAYYPSSDDGNVLLKDTDEGIMHEFVPTATDDLALNTWYFEAVDGQANTYFIKLYNGYYLTYSSSVADGSETVADPKLPSDSSSIINQEWKITANGDGYDLQNLGHIARWGNYYFGKVDGKMKFGSGLKAWLLNNNANAYMNKTKLSAPSLTASGYVVSWAEVSGATAYEVYVDGVLADTVSETTYTVTKDCKVQVKAISSDDAYLASYLSSSVNCSDLFAKKVWAYYNDSHKTLGYVDGDDGDIFKIGSAYTDVSDYAAYEWTVSLVPGTNYYTIAFDSGLNLSYFDNSASGNVPQTKAVVADATDSKQQWKLISDGTNAYKLENVYLSNYYSNVYLGEYYGVYKFNGVCTSWVFANV
ncbi:MAG: hypothetical protein LKK13_02355 [Bacilli bacterium]|jgi:hypothetical protein|nr:hypothetical protein [Bacilli bacterium]